MNTLMRVLVFGTFDGLHPGHHFVLERARERGEVAVVVARDATVQRIKGRSPLQDEEERAERIRRAYPAARVVLGDAADYLAPVRALRPDVILLGYDQEMPPGVRLEDLPCPVERLAAFEPQRHKSSLHRDSSRSSTDGAEGAGMV